MLEGDAKDLRAALSAPFRGGVLPAWLAALVIGIALSLQNLPWVIVDGQAHPGGQDDFYHATRMLEIAADPASTYQLDPQVHWPDGMQVSWPWAYDWVAGSLAGALGADREDASRWLMFYPLLWLVGSISVLCLALRDLLPTRLLAICLLAYATSPSTLALDSIGHIDHHGAEHFFMLLVLWLLLRWLRRPASISAAAWLGAVLALSTAFHNFLFVLQLPVLATLLAARRRQVTMQADAALGFAASLVLVQALVLLPSEPFLGGQYQFYLHSWFHLHAAGLTALGVVALAQPSWRRAWLLLLVAGALSAPVLLNMGTGMAYLRAEFPLWDEVLETQAPFSGDIPVADLVRFYSWLIALWPLGLGISAWALVSRTSGRTLACWSVFALFGLGLMALQVRFFNYGYVFLLAMPLWLAARMGRPRADAILAAVLLVACNAHAWIYFDASRLVGGGERYQAGFVLIDAARKACAEEPGLLLADSNWGHYLRYQTQCPLLASNHLITPADAEFLRRSRSLMSPPPSAVLASPVPVRYVLVSRWEKTRFATQLLEGEAPREFRELEVMRDRRDGRVGGKLFRIEPVAKDGGATLDP